MKTPLFPAALVAAMFGLTDAALITHVANEQLFWPHPWAVVTIGWILSQVALGAAWCIFAKQNVVIRTLVLLLIQLVAASSTAFCADGNTSSWMLAVGVYMLSVIGILLALRFGSLDVHWDFPKRDQIDGAGSSSPPKHQFTMLELLSWMTATCILLAFWIRQSIPWEIAMKAGLFFGFLGIVAVCSIWCGMRFRMRHNLLLLFAGSIAAYHWFTVLDFTGLDRASLITLVMILQCLLIGLSLMLRSLGCQVRRRFTTRQQMTLTQLPS